MIKHLRLFSTLLLLAVASMAWGQTGTIEFGTNKVKINAAVVYAQDNLGNTWDLGTTGTTSFTPNTNYCQIGSSSKPASKITFKTTLPNDVTITSFSAKFGGFSGTAGTITLSVDDETVGTGSLDGTNDVTVTSSSEATGKEIKVTVTEIAKGVKCYYVSYTYTSSTPSVAVPTFSPAAGAVEPGTEVTLTQGDASLIMYTLDETDPSFENSIGYEYENPIVITTPTTIKAIAVDNDGNVSPVASASYTIEVTAPSFTPNGGEVDEGSTVTITAGEGSSIYYTVDGTDPTNASTPYTSPISINNALILKAIAYDAYGNASNVTTRNFTVKIAGGIEIVPNYEFFGLNSSTSGSDKNEVTGTKDGLTLTYTRNEGSLYLSGSAMRFYKSNTLKIDAPMGKNIVKVVFTQSNGQTDDMVSNPTGYISSTKTWEGESTSVTFSRPENASSYLQFTKIIVVLSDNGIETVSTPQFSVAEGEYDEAQTVEITCATKGAAIHYTTDGNAPTSESATYISAITISETTTLKAIAVKEGMNNSQIAEATYTITTGGETPVTSDWVKAELADLTSNDIFVIVGNNGVDYALANDNGTSSAPTAEKVTVDGNYLTGEVADNIKWNISGNATDGYTFYPDGSTTTWLYCTNTNNGVRVGTGEAKVFTQTTNSYLTTTQTTDQRYIGIYNSQDWRCYTSEGGNIAGQTFTFYKYTGAKAPSITAEAVEIAYDAISGSISYTIKKAVDGGTLTATSSENWLTVGTPAEGSIALTCEANNETSERTATVTLTYTFNEGETVTKEVTVTQAAAPVVYTTIPALFDAATSTATAVNVTFGGWIISAVNGNNAYLTDNEGHGLIIYNTNDHGFNVGDVLTGTASCKLQLYRGSAELTALTSTTEGLTVTPNGSVTTILNIAMRELGGVNTGALIKYEKLTYKGTELVDADGNTLTPYNSFYEGTFEEGALYTVTGIYVQYNDTKEILPRSAADIVEVIKVKISAAGYATFANAKAVDFSAAEGLTVLTAKYDAENDKIVYNEVTSKKVPAGKAVVLKGEAKEYTGTVIEEAPELENNDLQVNLSESFNSDGTQYCLAKKNEVVGFYKVKAGVAVKAGKAYLEIERTGSTGAKDFYAIDDETDGIRQIENGQSAIDNAEIYNLSGQRVNKAQKGIYIVNGKKVVVK